MNPMAEGFPEISQSDLRERCAGEVVRRRAALQAMESSVPEADILAQFNALSVSAGTFDDALSILQNASPDARIRDAAQEGLELLMPIATEIFQSRALFDRVYALSVSEPQDAAYRQWLLEQFEDSGAALAPPARQRAKHIQDEIIQLCLRFQKNVNDDETLVALTDAQVTGLPDGWLAERRRDPQGRILVSLDYPCYAPFIELAQDADARRLVWTAYQGRVGASNLALMDRAVELRHELAQVHGYQDFATFSLRRKMAGTPTAVAQFLASITSAVDALEARELVELRAEKAALMGTTPDQVQVQRWDVAYLQQRIRLRRFHIDPEAMRENFPTAASVDFVMKTTERLYGIRFLARDVPVWHKDVRYFDVCDDGDPADQGSTAAQVRGGIFLDLFPRAGKYSHAALFSVRRGSALAGSNPVKSLVCNFNREGLTPDELETLFHEFGHAMHGVLSRARYADQAGTSVRHDFVEVPSLMFEEWARREVSLREFAHIAPAAPALGREQLAQLAAARHFGAGLRYARQVLYAMYDLKLHTGAPQSALSLWAALESQTRLGHVEGTMMPASFGHLMGGYEAGYYSYLWSEVLAADMVTAFGGNLLDPVVGRRYRQIILEPGGSRPPQDLVREFLGRDPESGAFFEEIASAAAVG